MKLQLLVFADLHLHSFREFATYEDGENSRLLEIAARLGNALALATVSTRKADCIVFAGDFYDNKSQIDVSALTHARRIFEHFNDSKIPVILCSGTHDIGRNLRSTLISLEGSQEELYIDLSPGPCHSVCVPSPVGGEDHAEKIKESITGMDRARLKKEGILVTHGFVYGSHYGVPPNIIGGLQEEFLLNTFKLSIVGHYHNPSRHFYLDEKLNRAILVPGAVIPHNFGNPDPGRAWFVTIENGDIQVSEHIWDHPKFVTRDVSIGRLPKLNTEDYYRLFTAPGQEVEIPDGVRAIVIQREEIQARARVENISVGDQPEDLVKKYVCYKSEEAEAALPAKPSVLTRIGKVLAQSKDRELSDEDTEKLEELFDGTN